MTYLSTLGPRRTEIRTKGGVVLATANTVIANEDRAETFERVAAMANVEELLRIVRSLAAKGHEASIEAMGCIEVDVETLEATYKEFALPTSDANSQEAFELHRAADKRLVAA